MSRFIKQPDLKFIEQAKMVCARPAMYLGRTSYADVCMFLTGLALGYQDWWGGFMHSWLEEDFREFLLKKYRFSPLDDNVGWANSATWWQIYPLRCERDEVVVTDAELIARFVSDMDDYYNVLIRMAVATWDAPEVT
ncbi:MAG: hypothetical protein AB7L09_02785 [Nitrospira sp.]